MKEDTWNCTCLMSKILNSKCEYFKFLRSDIKIRSLNKYDLLYIV